VRQKHSPEVRAFDCSEDITNRSDLKELIAADCISSPDKFEQQKIKAREAMP
jgi:hypothetical protein